MEGTKQYEINFVDGSTETVMGDLPPSISFPMYEVKESQGFKVREALHTHPWWTCTLLAAPPDQAKLVPHGRVHINLSNVTFIKEC